MLFFLQMVDTPEEKKKFMQVYDQYRDLLYYKAYQILKNSEDAEDALQNALLKIAENIDKISEPVCSKTKSFVVIIVERKAIDILRARKRHPTEELEASLNNERFQSSMSDDKLSNCILNLPERYREVMLLRYYHGYSVKEISEILDISVFAAAKLSQRAKKKLKILCEEDGLL